MATARGSGDEVASLWRHICPEQADRDALWVTSVAPSDAAAEGNADASKRQWRASVAAAGSPPLGSRPRSSGSSSGSRPSSPSHFLRSGVPDPDWFRKHEVGLGEPFRYSIATQPAQEQAAGNPDLAASGSPGSPQASAEAAGVVARRTSLLFPSVTGLESPPDSPAAALVSRGASPLASEDREGEGLTFDSPHCDSVSGFSGFSFPTTPSCNEEEELEPEVEPEPVIGWPIPAASADQPPEPFGSGPVHQHLDFGDGDGGGGGLGRAAEEQLAASFGGMGSLSQGGFLAGMDHHSQQHHHGHAHSSSCSTSYQGSDDGADNDDARFHHHHHPHDHDHLMAAEPEHFEVTHLRVIHTKGKTGLEASREFAIVPNEVIAGRYKVVATLGDKSSFSRAVQVS